MVAWLGLTAFSASADPREEFLLLEAECKASFEIENVREVVPPAGPKRIERIVSRVDGIEAHASPVDAAREPLTAKLRIDSRLCVEVTPRAASPVDDAVSVHRSTTFNYVYKAGAWAISSLREAVEAHAGSLLVVPSATRDFSAEELRHGRADYKACGQPVE